jgi:hypothetical protein
VWFDISRVRKPADKTAWTFRKIASCGVLSSAEWAEMDHLVFPKSIRNKEDMERTLHKLAAIEKRIDAMADGRVDNELLTLAQGVPDESLDIGDVPTMDVGNVLRSLMDAKIVLRLEDFLRLLLGSANYNKIPQGDLEEMKNMLPGVLGRMSGSEELDDSCYFPEDSLAASPFSGIIDSLEPELSLKPKAVSRRVSLSVIKRPGERPIVRGPVVQVKSGSAQDRMVKQYALYELAASRYIGDDFVNKMIILQNYNKGNRK